MIRGADVLQMLIPDGGWFISGDDYENIQFLECEPITKKEYSAGFAKVESWNQTQLEAKATAKAALLERLGITAEEAALLLG